MKSLTVLLLATVGICRGVQNAASYLQESSVSNAVYLQGFNWDSISHRGAQFDAIAADAAKIGSFGFSGVWFPPATESVDLQGYMPTKWFSLVYNDSLSKAISALSMNGVEAIADVVVNHRSGTKLVSCSNTWIGFEEPEFPTNAVVSNDYQCDGNAPKFCSGGCACGAPDTGDNFCGGPDLDHSNPVVQQGVIDYLTHLRAYGFSAWRFDMVKGYHGSYISHYIKASNPTFAVGEFFDSDVNNVKNWVDNAESQSTAFDFPLRASLKSAIQSDYYGGVKFAGLMSHNSLLASTFIDNHDTARNDRFGSPDQIMNGYAVILTHPGIPFVFWDDYKNQASAINSLMAIRKAAGINSGSKMYVSAATNGVYAAFIFGENQVIAAKIGSGSWSPAPSTTGWKLQLSGNNYAVWSLPATAPFVPYYTS